MSMKTLAIMDSGIGILKQRSFASKIDITVLNGLHEFFAFHLLWLLM